MLDRWLKRKRKKRLKDCGPPWTSPKISLRPNSAWPSPPSTAGKTEKAGLHPWLESALRSFSKRLIRVRRKGGRNEWNVQFVESISWFWRILHRQSPFSRMADGSFHIRAPGSFHHFPFLRFHQVCFILQAHSVLQAASPRPHPGTTGFTPKRTYSKGSIR